MGFKSGAEWNGNELGRPRNEDSIRHWYRKLSEMNADDLKTFRPKTTAQLIALKRVQLAVEDNDYKNIDAFTEQVDGKLAQTQKIQIDDAKIKQLEEFFSSDETE